MPRKAHISQTIALPNPFPRPGMQGARNRHSPVFQGNEVACLVWSLPTHLVCPISPGHLLGMEIFSRLISEIRVSRLSEQ